MTLVNAYLAALSLSLCLVVLHGAGWSVTIIQSLFLEKNKRPLRALVEAASKGTPKFS